MTLYRKKPVVIEAMEWGGTLESSKRIHQAFGDAIIAGKPLACVTLEGWLYATAGDYIIRGVKGEVYPCKPDVFAMTYEVA